MDTRPVFFVRHKFTPEVCKELRSSNLIAYNYVDEFHEDIDDYTETSRGLVQAFNAFNAMASHGAIVVIEYESGSEFWIAEIGTGQKVERKDIDGGVYKALRFQNAKLFGYNNMPLLAAIRPPYVTVCETGRSFHQLTKHLYLGERLELATDFMHPSSIELMCEAFLRSELAPSDLKLKYTLLRTGKTMPAVDIFGKTTSGKPLFAQVTYGAGRPDKTSALIDFAAGGGITVLFSKDKKLSVRGLDHHFCIDEVFETFLSSKNPDWAVMLREMVGIS